MVSAIRYASETEDKASCEENWRLSDATPAQRANWQLIGAAMGSIGWISTKI
jgi:hypothetical protein